MSLLSGDHPRVRGEHFSAAISRIKCWGSSPRTRGAHLKSCAITQTIPYSASVYQLASTGAILPRPVMLSGITPSLLVNARQRCVIRPARSLDKLDAIAIDHLPVRLECLKSKVLLVSSGIYHDRPPISQHAYYPLPQPLAQPCRYPPNENSGRNFEQPSAQIALDARWARRQHDYRHTVPSQSQSA